MTLTKAFTQLRATLLGKAAAITGNRAEAEDAVQDAFARLWTAKREIADDDQAQALSRVAVRNASIDILRRRDQAPVNAAVALDLAERTQDLSESQASQEDADEFFDTVQSLIDRYLSPRDRELLMRREMHGYEYAELADLYGISEANVRMIVSRARKTIRELYRNLK